MAIKFSPTMGMVFLMGPLFTLVLNVPVVNGLSQALCSSQNTGSSNPVLSYQYQSNGHCFNNCEASYAFAIVQDENCWCSNYAPADTTSLESCSLPCPGFPYEKCGSSDTFGYIALNKAPLGTIGASESQSSTSSPAQASTSISQVVSSPTSPQAVLSSSSFPAKVSSSPAKAVAVQLSSGTFVRASASQQSLISTFLTPSVQTSLFVPKPVTVHQTITASPSVKISLVSITPSTTPETIIETTTAFPSAAAKSTTHSTLIPVVDSTTSDPPPSVSYPSSMSTSILSSPMSISEAAGSSSSASTWTPTPITSVMTVTGQVKTITITPTAPPAKTAVIQSSDGGFMSHPGKVAGLFVGVGLIICLLGAILIWFCLRRKRDSEGSTIASTIGGATPQRRVSKLSTMGLLGGSRRSANRKSVPPIQTSGWGPSNGTEKSPTETPIDFPRSSYPRVIDQRLEPAALWNPLHDNGSHVSIQSFRDDQDYSRRMLRVANPDIRPDTRDA